jgi:hypothetical protein
MQSARQRFCLKYLWIFVRVEKHYGIITRNTANNNKLYDLHWYRRLDKKTGDKVVGTVHRYNMYKST